MDLSNGASSLGTTSRCLKVHFCCTGLCNDKTILLFYSKRCHVHLWPGVTFTLFKIFSNLTKLFFLDEINRTIPWRCVLFKMDFNKRNWYLALSYSFTVEHLVVGVRVPTMGTDVLSIFKPAFLFSNWWDEHAEAFLSVCAPLLEQLQCSFGLTSGSSLIKEH